MAAATPPASGFALHGDCKSTNGGGFEKGDGSGEARRRRRRRRF